MHPRGDVERHGLKAIAEGVKDRPDTLVGTIAADMLAHYSPDFRRVDFVDVVRNNAWPE